MRKIIFILFILTVGCASQKRCFEKFPPDTITTVNTIHHTEYIDTIIYKYLPGDTVFVQSQLDTVKWIDYPVDFVPPGMIVAHNVEPIYAETELAYSKAWMDTNNLKLLLVQKDSLLQIKLDSIRVASIDTIVINNTEIVEKVVEPKSFKSIKVGLWITGVLSCVLLALLIIFFKIK